MGPQTPGAWQTLVSRVIARRGAEMDRTETLAWLSGKGLARVAADLERLVQPSIRLVSQPPAAATLAVGASQLGGLPDLPPNTPWPQGKSGPLAFIAQIRLEEVQGLEGAGALPESGLLSFFYDAAQETYGADPADRGGWQVLYTPDATQTQRLPGPPSLPQAARYPACALAYASEMTLPQQPELELPALSWTADERARYEQALVGYAAAATHGPIRNRLLGHPDTIQDDMRLECQLAAHGVSSLDDPRATSLTPNAMRWRLLLQVDSDPNAHMRWASAGMLYYWIEDDALSARRFEDVWVVLQSD